MVDGLFDFFFALPEFFKNPHLDFLPKGLFRSALPLVPLVIMAIAWWRIYKKRPSRLAKIIIEILILSALVSILMFSQVRWGVNSIHIISKKGLMNFYIIHTCAHWAFILFFAAFIWRIPPIGVHTENPVNTDDNNSTCCETLDERNALE